MLLVYCFAGIQLERRTDWLTWRLPNNLAFRQQTHTNTSTALSYECPDTPGCGVIANRSEAFSLCCAGIFISFPPSGSGRDLPVFALRPRPGTLLWTSQLSWRRYDFLEKVHFPAKGTIYLKRYDFLKKVRILWKGTISWKMYDFFEKVRFPAKEYRYAKVKAKKSHPQCKRKNAIVFYCCRSSGFYLFTPPDFFVLFFLLLGHIFSHFVSRFFNVFQDSLAVGAILMPSFWSMVTNATESRGGQSVLRCPIIALGFVLLICCVKLYFSRL